MRFSLTQKSTATLLEFAGFLFILIAAVFQWSICDRFASASAKYSSYIQGQMQISTLTAIGEIAVLNVEDDPASKANHALAIKQQASKAAMMAIDDTKHMDGDFSNQGGRFSDFRWLLFGLGSVLIVTAKFSQFLVARREESEKIKK